jgi:hypothetical protein
MVVAGQSHSPVALPPGKRQRTHRTEGLVGPRAGPDGFWKFRPHRESVFRPSRPYRVAIPVTLPWPTGNNIKVPERKDGKPFPNFYKINLLLTGEVRDKQELIPLDRWNEKEHRTSNRLTKWHEVGRFVNDNYTTSSRGSRTLAP